MDEREVEKTKASTFDPTFFNPKINGMTKIVKPYWASVAHDRDYFEATSPKPWTDRDLKLDTNPDDRFKQVPGKLMANSTETNAFKLYLKPEVMYTLELRELPLADDGRKVVRMEPWRTFIVRLSKESNTPFTLEYGDNE